MKAKSISKLLYSILLSLIFVSCEDPGFTKLTFSSSVNAEARIEYYNGTEGVALYYSALPFWLRVPQEVLGYKVIRVKLADAKDKTSLYVANFPESLIVIDSLSGCTNLTEITFPSTLKVFPLMIGCTTLESIEIPDNVNTLLNSTFSGCTALKNIKFGKGLYCIDTAAFSKCTALSEITLPDTVSELHSNAFSDCTALTTVSTGNGLSFIPETAFSGCTAIKTLYLGKKLTGIEAGAFEKCSNLSTVTCHAEEPPSIEKTSFKTTEISSTSSTSGSDSTDENNYTIKISLKVPSNSIEKYKNHKIWGKFTSITEI
ncbi:MAG: leucine-rich repeat domain-containing protein [Treponema sp.]|nr:leucine-rich repeat domain-containing protein [Treponema sp.]